MKFSLSTQILEPLIKLMTSAMKLTQMPSAFLRYREYHVMLKCESCIPIVQKAEPKGSAGQDAHLAEKKLMLRIPHQTACQGRRKCAASAHFFI